MRKEMNEIHEDVFQLLLRYHGEDPNFLFTMRQTNRYGRLDKGYWFLGTDDYLAVSFWKGSDWKNKTPNIYLSIDNKERCQIVLNAKSSDIKADFLKDYIWPILIEEINPEKEDLWHEFKTVHGVINLGHYTNAIEYFKNKIKSRIDKQIFKFETDYEAAIESEQQLANEFDNPNEFKEPDELDFIYPIELNEFNKQLQRVLKYKSYLQQREIPKYLNRIEIKSFGLIKNIIIENIPKKCRWIFLTGENGAGKSTFLKALTVGLYNNLDGEEKIIANNENEPIDEFLIQLKYSDKKNKYIKQTTKWNDNINETLPKPWKGCAGYGAIRLNVDDDSIKVFNGDAIEKALNKECYNIFNSIGILHKIDHEWLFESSNYDSSLIIEHLQSIIPTIYKVYHSFPEGLEFLECDNNSLPMNKAVCFNQLPSGTRSLVSLIVDLFIRFSKQQPDIDDPSKYTGIVLIDEIDIHLHPIMQKEIVEQLSATFPNIQFIVTTHSPIPILGAPDDSVVLTVKKESRRGVCVERWDDKIPVKKLLPNALLTSPIFNLDDLIPVNESLKNIRTEDNFEEAFFNYMLQKEVDKLKNNDNEV